MPTIDPRMVMPFRTVSKIGRLTWLSAGRATKTRVPPRRSELKACSKAFGATATEMAACAPPRAWMACDRVLGQRVHHVVGAEILREFQLLVGDVDRDDAGAADLRVLQREVAEPADAEDRDQRPGAGPGELDRLVGRHPGAGQHGRVEGVHRVGDLSDVGGVRGGVFGVGAVPAVAGVDLLLAQRLPPVDAVLADPAGLAEPRHRDPVADLRRARRPAPTCSTIPTPSWPGMNGGVGLTGQSPWAAWMSVWHRPEVSTLTRTSPGPGTGFGTSSTLSGLVKSWTTAAFMGISKVVVEVFDGQDSRRSVRSTGPRAPG